MNYLVGDLVGVVLALGESKAILVGHDWGAQIVWIAAMIRPDVFYAVCGMSITFSGKVPMLPEGLTIMDLYKSAAGPDRQYYRVYFQQIGVAEKELEKDVRKSVLGLLYTLSSDIVRDQVQNVCFDGFFPANSSMLDSFVVPEKLPEWLTEKDLVQNHTICLFLHVTILILTLNLKTIIILRSNVNPRQHVPSFYGYGLWELIHIVFQKRYLFQWG
jgi:pimeloyl-ACP methyl ester carboxylesterase